MTPGLEAYTYQPEREADKNALESKIEALELYIDSIKRRIEIIKNEATKRSLEVQIDIKTQELQTLKKGLSDLISEIEKAQDDDNKILN